MPTATTFRFPLHAALPSDDLSGPLDDPEQADADGQDDGSSENGFKADTSGSIGFIAEAADADAEGHL